MFDSIQKDRGARRGRGFAPLVVLAMAAICGGLASAGAAAPLERVVYQETFEDEASHSYPYAPEVDDSAVRGLWGHSFGPGTLGPGPEIVAGRARFSPPIDGQMVLENAVFPHLPNGIGRRSIGVRARFTAMSVSAGSTAAFDTYLEFVADNGERTEISVTLLVNASGATPIARLDVWEKRYVPGVPVTTSLWVAGTLLPQAVPDAIASGGDCSLDVLVDRQAGTVGVWLDAALIPIVSIPPTLSSTLHASDAFRSLHTSVRGPTTAVPGVVSLDLDTIEIYHPIANRFVVNSFVDGEDLNPGDLLCETASGGCTLRAAVQESNALAGLDEIVLSAGTHLLELEGVEEDDAALGDLDINDSTILTGAGRNATIIDASGIDRVFDLTKPDPYVDVQLLDLRITNGSALADQAADGGGVRNRSALFMTRCVVDANVANTGGGIMNHGHLVMEDCVVRDNVVMPLPGLSANGGGIGSRAESTGLASPWLNLRDAAVANNHAPSTGGVQIAPGSGAFMDSVTLSGNDGVQLDVVDGVVLVQHATLYGGGETAALKVRSPGATGAVVELLATAIHGSPACDLDGANAAVVDDLGKNAISDASCMDNLNGSATELALRLSPLLPIHDSFAHLPMQSSPLIDRGDSLWCRFFDQVGMPRHIDGDGSGTAQCDAGSIEAPVPEPGFATALATASLMVASFARRSRSRSARRIDGATTRGRALPPPSL